MRGPGGNVFLTPAYTLKSAPNERLVFTNAYITTGAPSAKPSVTATITLEGDGPDINTPYAVFTGPKEDRDLHEQMSFRRGPGLCSDQLEAVAFSF